MTPTPMPADHPYWREFMAREGERIKAIIRRDDERRVEAMKLLLPRPELRILLEITAR